MLCPSCNSGQVDVNHFCVTCGNCLQLGCACSSASTSRGHPQVQQPHSVAQNNNLFMNRQQVSMYQQLRQGPAHAAGHLLQLHGQWGQVYHQQPRGLAQDLQQGVEAQQQLQQGVQAHQQLQQGHVAQLSHAQSQQQQRQVHHQQPRGVAEAQPGGIRHHFPPQYNRQRFSNPTNAALPTKLNAARLFEELVQMNEDRRQERHWYQKTIDRLTKELDELKQKQREAEVQRLRDELEQIKEKGRKRGGSDDEDELSGGKKRNKRS